MEPINYSWSESSDKSNDDNITDIKDNGSDKLIDGHAESKSQSKNKEEKLPTRNNLQITRRLFHMGNGVAIATLYWISFSHAQMLHFLGTAACLLYVFEQVRINYPEKAQKLLPFTKFVMRAEEQLKESAMVPYCFAVLLTIITFPKAIALVAVYTLAIADPLSAIIGIKYGKRRLVSHKTLEGSAAFFISTFVVSMTVLSIFYGSASGLVMLVSLLIAFLGSAFEMIPLKLDDNLTIPLFTSFVLWILCETMGLGVYL